MKVWLLMAALAAGDLFPGCPGCQVAPEREESTGCLSCVATQCVPMSCAEWGRIDSELWAKERDGGR